MASYWNIKPITLIPRLLLDLEIYVIWQSKVGHSLVSWLHTTHLLGSLIEIAGSILVRLLSKTICIVENYSNINAKAQITRQSSMEYDLR